MISTSKVAHLELGVGVANWELQLQQIGQKQQPTTTTMASKAANKVQRGQSRAMASLSMGPRDASLAASAAPLGHVLPNVNSYCPLAGPRGARVLAYIQEKRSHGHWEICLILKN